MHTASFKIQKTKLKAELALINKAYRGIGINPCDIVLEITITDNLVTLVVPGVKLEVPCETYNTAKATIGFRYFNDIVKSWGENGIEVIFTDNEMQIGITKIKIDTTFFEDDTILRSIKLPINYTDKHLLQLEQKGYTIEELRFNKIAFELYSAKKSLIKNTAKVATILKIYGVTKIEIENLIESKIKLNTSTSEQICKQNK